MTTLESLIYKTADELSGAGLSFGHGTDNAFDEAAWLVLYGLGLPPDKPIEDPQQMIAENAIERVKQLLDERIKTRKPLAYIINSAWFCGHEFYVDQRVLVPRSPIAEMIAQSFMPWLQQAPQKILDLCCGSGCIAIACAHRFSDALVHASDISTDALDVTNINIQKHQLDKRVMSFKSDVFNELPSGRYDLIVSNPPYVDQADLSTMPCEFQHEPVLGLAAGGDGLEIVRRILHDALDFLSDQGILVVEVGNSAEHLLQAFPRVAFTWVDFAYGGDGVLLMTADELKTYQRIL